jgi:phage shock protein A
MDRVGSKSAFAEFRRLEDRVDRAEAMGEAYERLEGRDPNAEELEREFEASERQDRLAKEFEELKRRVSNDA